MVKIEVGRMAEMMVAVMVAELDDAMAATSAYLVAGRADGMVDWLALEMAVYSVASTVD